ncbi:MAG: CsgG/HfaB family protein [Candidatus Methylacidiphilales bacterium]
MKRNLSILTAIAWVWLTPIQAAEPLTVAVLDFSTSATGAAAPPTSLFEVTLGERGKTGSLGAEIGILLNAYLSASPDIILVEREELAKLLGEQELGLSGTVNPDSAARLGYLTGAKVLVTGRAFEAGGKHFAVARIISTETGRVFGETVTYANPETFDQACQELAGKIEKVVSTRGESLVAKVEEPDTQIKRLEAMVKGKDLPSVAVNIPEQHLSRAIPDPAVETELRLILAKLGFVVIDTKASTDKPDIEIKGEAFSEFAARKGNLVSCRARVEIQVFQNESNKLLLSDREVGVAVDLAENVAAKEALARAARKLADRIVPKLVGP